MNTHLQTAPPDALTRNRFESQPRPAASVSMLATLVSDIGSDAQTLVQEHGELLKAELAETRDQAVRSVVLVGAAAGAVAIGGLFLLVGLVLLTGWLFPTLPVWAPWLIWGGVLAVAAVIAALIGIRGLTHLQVVPRRTVRSLKESWSCLLNRPN